jgi:hypothetical protein
MVVWAKDLLPTPHQALIEVGLAREDASESGSQFTASESGTRSMGIDEAEEFFSMQHGMASPPTGTEEEGLLDKRALLNAPHGSPKEEAGSLAEKPSEQQAAPTLAALGLVNCATSEPVAVDASAA